MRFFLSAVAQKMLKNTVVKWGCQSCTHSQQWSSTNMSGKQNVFKVQESGYPYCLAFICFPPTPECAACSLNLINWRLPVGAARCHGEGWSLRVALLCIFFFFYGHNVPRTCRVSAAFIRSAWPASEWSGFKLSLLLPVSVLVCFSRGESKRICSSAVFARKKIHS